MVPDVVPPITNAVVRVGSDAEAMGLFAHLPKIELK